MTTMPLSLFMAITTFIFKTSQGGIEEKWG